MMPRNDVRALIDIAAMKIAHCRLLKFSALKPSSFFARGTCQTVCKTALPARIVRFWHVRADGSWSSPAPAGGASLFGRAVFLRSERR